eukprot:913004-Pyramimonas_sp.AAC.1
MGRTAPWQDNGRQVEMRGGRIEEDRWGPWPRGPLLGTSWGPFKGKRNVGTILRKPTLRETTKQKKETTHKDVHNKNKGWRNRNKSVLRPKIFGRLWTR